jgi:hypothetical protein
MEIETRFNVNDLVQRKFDNQSNKGRRCLEIMEIAVQVCYTTVQIFYLCKPIVAIQETEGYGDNKKISWQVGHGIGKEDNSLGWYKYREDELVPTDEETIKIITGTK